jgi:hypothetical protein
MSKRRPHFFSKNNLTFVIQMLIHVFPRIVFVQTFFGVKQQDSTPQNDSTLGFKWIKKIAQNIV